MSDLDQFELFVLVAQLGSIASASKVLGLSKASISKKIKQLDNARNLCFCMHSEPSMKLHIVTFPYFARKLNFPKLKHFLDTGNTRINLLN